MAADPGREFAWAVGGTIARWTYTFTEVDDGTEVTESWQFLPTGEAMFEEHFGDRAGAEITDRYERARDGIPETLAAIKRAAEAQPASSARVMERAIGEKGRSGTVDRPGRRPGRPPPRSTRR